MKLLLIARLFFSKDGFRLKYSMEVYMPLNKETKSFSFSILFLYGHFLYFVKPSFNSIFPFFFLRYFFPFILLLSSNFLFYISFIIPFFSFLPATIKFYLAPFFSLSFFSFSFHAFFFPIFLHFIVFFLPLLLNLLFFTSFFNSVSFSFYQTFLHFIPFFRAFFSVFYTFSPSFSYASKFVLFFLYFLLFFNLFLFLIDSSSLSSYFLFLSSSIFSFPQTISCSWFIPFLSLHVFFSFAFIHQQFFSFNIIFFCFLFFSSTSPLLSIAPPLSC